MELHDLFIYLKVLYILKLKKNNLNIVSHSYISSLIRCHVLVMNHDLRYEDRHFQSTIESSNTYF